jgi:hypothetical protein
MIRYDMMLLVELLRLSDREYEILNLSESEDRGGVV